MEIKIRKIGSFFQLNDQGQLINPANLSFIPPKLEHLISTIKQSYQLYYGEQLHSLYLRGSLVRGSFVEEVSDIDVIGLVKNEDLRWQEATFKKELEHLLGRKLQNLKLELMISSYDSNLVKNYPQLAMILKTQSICICGTDITPTLPHFYPNRSVLLHYRWLEQDLAAFFTKEKITADDRKTMHKMLIRCGLELVVERSGQFTLDLYPAVELFSRFYSKQSTAMQQILFYFLNPGSELLEQDKMIKKMGNWLIKEIKQEINFHIE